MDAQRISHTSTATNPGPTYLLGGMTVNGIPPVDLSVSIDGGLNQDSPTNFPNEPGNDTTNRYANIRWRHASNTQANFLVVDGHCESRSWKKITAAPGNVTEVLRKNLYVTQLP